MKRIVLLAAAACALIAPAAAQAAPPSPFGHACAPKPGGVLLCPTASDAQRVPSFDGVPIDVDVTLPAQGDGPFPTIVMMHGYGGDKKSFQDTTPEGDSSTEYHYNDVWFASRGYAVVTPSARGFGRSCGTPDSRTLPACDRGWIHLADSRYEARDVQHLLGLLVDQGVADPGALGVTGISYGGIQSQILARLRDRVRLPDGRYAPWRSPGGRGLEIAAAYARWAASDLTYSLVPNGRFLDFRGYRVGQSARPLGVMKQSYVNGLYAVGAAAGWVAPVGADPSADLTAWRDFIAAGEPYGGQGGSIANELTRFHSSAGVSGTPAPMIVQNGWTDDLFPAPEALRVYRTFRRTPGARISYQLGDLGHSRGSNKRNADRFFNDQGSRFFDAELRGQRVATPRHNSVVAFTQTCPKAARAGGPFRARGWGRLHPGSVAFGGRRGQTIRSTAGDPEVAAEFDLNNAGDACKTVATQRSRGTAVYQARVARPFTLLGLPTIRANLRTRGDDGMIVGRLWDVFRGKQRLIARGVYRLSDDQGGRLTFQLWGNGYRFRRGHRVKLELLGRDPNFVRTSNERFRVRLSKLRVELPVRERRFR